MRAAQHVVRRTLASLTLAVVAAQAGAVLAQQPAAPLSLPAAVETALANHPAMRGAHAGQSMADARLAEAQSGRLPRLSAGERITNSNNPVFVFGSLLEQGRFGPENFAVDSLNNPDALTNFRTSIEVSVPVFDQRQTSTKIAQSRLAREQADAQLDTIQQRLRFNVVQAYYGVLVAEAGKAVADEAVQSAEADRERLRKLFESGMIVASDVLAVEVQLADFRQKQIQATGDIASAYAALDTALGLPVDTPHRLSGELADRTFSAPAMEDLVRTALEVRPDYKQLELQVRIRDEAIHGAKGEYLPRVDAFASAGTSGHGLANASSDYSVGVSVSYSLFDAGRRARLDQALAARDVADAERQERADAIRLDVVRAYNDFVAAGERLRVAAAAIDQAAETLRIVRNRHAAGLTQVTEVLRAQTALVDARTSLVQARYAYTIGYARLLLVSGRLTDVAPFAA